MRGSALITHRVAAALGAAALMVTAAMAGGTPIEPAQAREWLARMHHAATQRNYQGTLVVTTGTSMSSSRIAHYCEGNQTFERVDVLDGEPRRVLRHNDKVLTLWPTAKVARLEQRELVQSFPALPTAGGEEPLFERYEMLAEGPGRVAGHEARVFLLRPRDGARFAQRLWAEQGSGLLLRADVIAPDGRVLETSAFSDLAIGGKAAKPESVLAALKQLDGWQLHKSLPQRTELEAEGWQIRPPAGFRKASCVKRALAADETRPAIEVVQAVFTDGLTHVSIFIEPHRPERHRPGTAALGATHTWMQAMGAHWVTVMGDVPMGTLKQFAAALERSR